jgi:hypothetical protein
MNLEVFVVEPRRLAYTALHVLTSSVLLSEGKPGSHFPSAAEGAGCVSDGDGSQVTEGPDIRQAGGSDPGHHQDRECPCSG